MVKENTGNKAVVFINTKELTKGEMGI